MINPVHHSLELAAERGGDLTAAVYARLFAAHPETEASFWRDHDQSIRGEMPERVIEAVLDFADTRRYAHSLIQCEVVRHANEIDTPPELFGSFFDLLRDTVRDLCGPDWTPQAAVAWSRLIDDLHWYVAHPDQHETLAIDGQAALRR